MLRYILRRLLQLIPVFFGATFILFLLLYVLPGDPASAIAGADRVRDPASAQVIREKFNLDKPVPVQYVLYMKAIFKGDLGESITLHRPVRSILGDTLPWSFKLALAAILVEVVLGVIAGVISAVKRYSFLDTLTTLSTSLLVAIPVFWLGLMLQISFGLGLKDTPFRLPITGVSDGWRSYILPAITLASVFTAITARLTRTTMLEVMKQDYIRTASAKGLSERGVVYKHGLRNALIPVVTNIGLDFGALISGAILTETVYSWPGVGRQVFLAINDHDNPLVIGATIFFLFSYMFVNLMVDISYAFLDPRIRYE
ncbi:MAG TPA: ABC transporter permease [Actinomycetota bacterium]|nr:ABC transporter permease [Actinomycetota bacterium]